MLHIIVVLRHAVSPIKFIVAFIPEIIDSLLTKEDPFRVHDMGFALHTGVRQGIALRLTSLSNLTSIYC